jgi:molecular chaperone DnaK
MIYSAEKTLRDYADKVPADLKSEIEGKISAVRSAQNGSDMAYLKSAVEDLSASMQKIGQAVYSQEQPGGPEGGPQGGPQGPDAGGPTDEGTVEGEFREV